MSTADLNQLKLTWWDYITMSSIYQRLLKNVGGPVLGVLLFIFIFPIILFTLAKSLFLGRRDDDDLSGSEPAGKPAPISPSPLMTASNVEPLPDTK